MARNRKRAKERRARRPAGATVAAAKRGGDGALEPLEHGSPDRIEHGAQPEDSPAARSGEAGGQAGVSGEVELAQAQLAVGRPGSAQEPGPVDDLASEPIEAGELVTGGGEADWELGPSESEGGESGAERLPAPRPQPAARLTHFLQGSWRELQRVQWPDRRQVMQATGVVIGFVIVAGAFLGVADFVAGKLMNLILK